MPNRIMIADWSQVPEFATEEEEFAFWDTHEPAAELIARSPIAHEKNAPRAAERDVDARTAAKSKNITVRVEADLLSRLNAVAAQKGIPYQTMLKQFAIERLYEEEKRLSIIEPAAR